MRSLRYNSRASAFAVVAFFLSVMFFAVLWFFMFSEDGFVTKVEDAASTVHSSLGTDTHDLYDDSVSFMDGITDWILVLVLIGLFIAGLVYTQRKRAEVYY